MTFQHLVKLNILSDQTAISIINYHIKYACKPRDSRAEFSYLKINCVFLLEIEAGIIQLNFIL